MSWFSRQFERKKGGTRVGNFLRNFVNQATYGVSNALGITDGHMVDGDISNGEYHY
ncbi:hypothetical protein [Flavobacterium sp. 3HN19-14]|uniref:hypothetical protein n=1 Tax=Flavobacterium sp. 3HN19-14 TaxID=3448133 RepID=UPI003EDF037A